MIVENLLLPSRYAEEDFIVSHKKVLTKKEDRKQTKGLKGGKDTEEKNWFIYADILSLSLQYERSARE